VNVVLGIARYGFLLLLIVFLLYVTYLMRRDLE